MAIGGVSLYMYIYRLCMYIEFSLTLQPPQPYVCKFMSMLVDWQGSEGVCPDCPIHAYCAGPSPHYGSHDEPPPSGCGASGAT